MTSPLLPALTDRSLTVDVALKQPSILRDRIAKLADDQILLPNFFRPFGTQLQGGGLLYSVVQASDFFTSDVEKRAPGPNTRSSRASTRTPNSRSSRTGAASSRSPPNRSAATT